MRYKQYVQPETRQIYESEEKKMYRINYENTEEYIRLENEIAEKSKVLKAMKADFIAQLQAEGKTEKTVGNGKGKVTYKNSPQNRFNQSKFKKDYPDLLQEYTELQDRWLFDVT